MYRILLVFTVLVSLLAVPVVLFYAGLTWTLENRYWSLTYYVHDGTDPARDYVEARGAHRILTYEEYADEIRHILVVRGVNADEADCMKQSIIGDLVDSQHGTIGSGSEELFKGYVYIQAGKCYCNREIQAIGVCYIGAFKARLFPTPVDLHDRIEAPLPTNVEILQTSSGYPLTLPEVIALEPAWPDVPPAGSRAASPE